MDDLLTGKVGGNPGGPAAAAGETKTEVPAAGVKAVDLPVWGRPLAECLPEEMRQEKSLGNFKTLSDLAKGFVDTKAALSRKTDGMVKVPGESSKPEEWAEYYKAVGRPEKPEEYQAPHVDGVTLPIEDAELQWFRTVAHGVGLTQKQFASVYTEFLQRREGALQALNQQALQSLQQEYPGEKFTDQMALYRLGMARLPEAVRNNIAGRKMIDVDLFKAVTILGNVFRSDRAPENLGPPATESGINYARVAEIDRIISDPKTMSSERKRLIAEKRQMFNNVK